MPGVTKKNQQLVMICGSRDVTRRVLGTWNFLLNFCDCVLGLPPAIVSLDVTYQLTIYQLLKTVVTNGSV
jgi:hypothetical protein